MPSIDIDMAVTAGEKITKYLAFVRSASIPIKGFNNIGMRCMTERKPAKVRLKP
jgi:hypothetical protein